MKLILPTLIAFPAIALASGPYSQTAVVPWKPENATSVDVSTVVNGTYYLSDRTNGIVHVVDLSSATEIDSISGFVGAHIVNGTLDKSTSGPAGLLGIPGRNELYVGDGDGTVKVVDLSSNKVVDKIQLDIKKRADEMTFDAKRNLAIVTGPDDDIASIWFISVTDRKIVGNMTFPNATNGVEKPAWNPTDGLLYLSVPETNDNPGGEIDVIDPSTFKVTKILPEPECSSHGIAFGQSQQLLLGCSQDSILAFGVAHTLIMDVTTGNITATINGVGGGDGVVYNPTTNYFYVADYQDQVNGSKTGAPDPKLAIIDAGTGTLVQTITTDNITAQSVAVDPKSNKLVVPIAAKGIVIYDLSNSTSTPSGTPSGTPSATGTNAPPATVSSSGAARGSLVSVVAVIGAAIVAGTLWV